MNKEDINIFFEKNFSDIFFKQNWTIDDCCIFAISEKEILTAKDDSKMEFEILIVFDLLNFCIIKQTTVKHADTNNPIINMLNNTVNAYNAIGCYEIVPDSLKEIVEKLDNIMSNFLDKFGKNEYISYEIGKKICEKLHYYKKI